MSEKTGLIGLFGAIAFSIFFITAVIHADQYYDQYSGNSFQPQFSSSTFVKAGDGSIYHNDDFDDFYFCPASFSVPDGSTYFIKSLGIRYKDNLTDGYLLVRLKRLNLYTGNSHTVASWNSGTLDSNPIIQTHSQGTETGYKLVDTKKFAYWLEIRFYRDGITNPSTNLMIYQVRIHYGT
jgi:hypothetical protein